MLHCCVVDCIVVGCQSSDRGLFFIHRHRDEGLSLMLHSFVVDCTVVGCQSSDRGLLFNTQASG